MGRKSVLWKLLAFAGTVPMLGVLLGGLYLWHREGWLTSDWAAWTVLMAMLFHPFLLTGLGLMIISLLKLRELKGRK